MPYSDLKMYTDKHIRETWQIRWDKSANNKLHEIRPQIGARPLSSRKTRREEIVLCRAKIGHSYTTHSYLLKGEPRPQCSTCQCPLTVKHILIECAAYAQSRKNLVSVSSMKDFFERNNSDSIVWFLKDIGIYPVF
jgi:hypothetical protein